ncbi:hypothetical protein BRC97_11080 [Halobacteriales archaeon QS_6_71_20]|nr:MAG: hypothetical protein BRC97_11080 [Halobacteriales archaeon QS_6_71_20]
MPAGSRPARNARRRCTRPNARPVGGSTGSTSASPSWSGSSSWARRTSTRRSRSCAFVAEAAETPFVDYAAPPPELVEFLDGSPAGAEPLPDVLAYVDYSRSKLDHYVDDPGTFSARVSPHRTYLERLSAAPLTVDWPPPAAGTLRFQRRELVSLVATFAPESTVARARALRSVADRPDYDRLRRAAEAAAELSDEEFERVAAGDAGEELSAARERRAALAAALADGE